MPSHYLYRCSECGHEEMRYRNSTQCRECHGPIERANKDEQVSERDNLIRVTFVYDASRYPRLHKWMQEIKYGRSRAIREMLLLGLDAGQIQLESMKPPSCEQTIQEAVSEILAEIRSLERTVYIPTVVENKSNDAPAKASLDAMNNLRTLGK